MAKIESVFAIIMLAVVAGVLYWIYKKGPTGVATAAVSAAGDVAAGAVVGVGKTVGIPQTDASVCDANIKDGKWWDASFSCSAPVFIKNLLGFGKTSTQPLQMSGGGPE